MLSVYYTDLGTIKIIILSLAQFSSCSQIGGWCGSGSSTGVWIWGSEVQIWDPDPQWDLDSDPCLQCGPESRIHNRNNGSRFSSKVRIRCSFQMQIPRASPGVWIRILIRSLNPDPQLKCVGPDHMNCEPGPRFISRAIVKGKETKQSCFETSSLYKNTAYKLPKCVLVFPTKKPQASHFYELKCPTFSQAGP